MGVLWQAISFYLAEVSRCSVLTLSSVTRRGGHDVDIRVGLRQHPSCGGHLLARFHKAACRPPDALAEALRGLSPRHRRHAHIDKRNDNTQTTLINNTVRVVRRKISFSRNTTNDSLNETPVIKRKRSTRLDHIPLTERIDKIMGTIQ